MTRLVWLLLVFGVFSCSAQSDEVRPLRFPMDDQSAIKAGGAELLEAVCPGEVKQSDRGVGCAGCPGQEISEHRRGDHPPPQLSIVSVIRGHFLSPASQDAVVWATGCWYGSYGQSGVFYLLTHRSGKWDLADQGGGLYRRCHKVRLQDKREVLVCIATYHSANGIDFLVYLQDFTSDAPEQMLYSLNDVSEQCGWGVPDSAGQLTDKPAPISLTYIDAIEFKNAAGQPPSFSIIVSKGTKLMRRQDCEDLPRKFGSPVIPTQSTRVTFSWTGETFERTSRGSTRK